MVVHASASWYTGVVTNSRCTCLPCRGEPWSQAEYLVELAEFVLHTERNQQLARDMLLEAASLLLRSDHTRLLGEIHTLDLFSVCRQRESVAVTGAGSYHPAT